MSQPSVFDSSTSLAGKESGGQYKRPGHLLRVSHRLLRSARDIVRGIRVHLRLPNPPIH